MEYYDSSQQKLKPHHVYATTHNKAIVITDNQGVPQNLDGSELDPLNFRQSTSFYDSQGTIDSYRRGLEKEIELNQMKLTKLDEITRPKVARVIKETTEEIHRKSREHAGRVSDALKKPQNSP
jgi:hypothetical protein